MAPETPVAAACVIYHGTMRNSTAITKIISAATASLAALALLTGCSLTSGSDDRILAKLDSMQREIDGLKGSNGSSASNPSGDGATNDAAGTDAGGSNGTDSSSAPTDENGFEQSVADLEKRADDAVATARAAKAPTDASQRPQAYIDAKAPLETLEHEADRLEDQLETAVRSGKLDRQTYFSLDQRVNAVDDKLDQGADALERIMGVDD